MQDAPHRTTHLGCRGPGSHHRETVGVQRRPSETPGRSELVSRIDFRGIILQRSHRRLMLEGSTLEESPPAAVRIPSGPGTPWALATYRQAQTKTSSAKGVRQRLPRSITSVFALQGGVKVPAPSLPSTLLSVHYTWIDPFSYTHYPARYLDFRIAMEVSKPIRSTRAMTLCRFTGSRP